MATKTKNPTKAKRPVDPKKLNASHFTAHKDTDNYTKDVPCPFCGMNDRVFINDSVSGPLAVYGCERCLEFFNATTPRTFLGAQAETKLTPPDKLYFATGVCAWLNQILGEMKFVSKSLENGQLATVLPPDVSQALANTLMSTVNDYGNCISPDLLPACPEFLQQ